MSQSVDPFQAVRKANPVRPDCLRTPDRAERAGKLLDEILRHPTHKLVSGNFSSVSWQGRTDAELLDAARRDREAFAAFYREHAVPVYRWFAYRVEREGALAAELTAETFAEALRSLPRFRGTVAGSGTAWLFGIARNLAREHHRSRRVRTDARRELGMPPAGALDGYLADADERMDSNRLRRELDSALDRLPPAQKQAVTLRVVEELDYPEIARAAETTEQAVRLRVSRGLRALRLQLTPATNEED